MELLSMDRVSNSNKKMVLRCFKEDGNTGRANKLIAFFSWKDKPSNYGDFILNGFLDELNEILNN